jgi:hypothetical protein
MTPPTAEKTATLNFRVSEDIPEMLRELAEDASVSMTDYVTALIRTSYRTRFPDKASRHETPLERLERQLLLQAPRQNRARPGGKRKSRTLAEFEAAFLQPKRK